MLSTKNSSILRNIAIIFAFLIVSLILWNTYDFFKTLKSDEREKVELYEDAQNSLSEKNDLNANINLESKILMKTAKNIPMIVTNKKGVITSSINLDPNKENDSLYLREQLYKMKGQNAPILSKYKGEIQGYIYYRNSNLITKLQYYPLALVLILFLFGSVIYLFFKSTKASDQNKLWSGMAKETAHQIGTPLTSLLGWIELLRMETVSEDIIREIEKDVYRLNTIAERFSKVGSIPALKKEEIISSTEEAFEYLKDRSSKQVSFEFVPIDSFLYCNINTQLHSWVIENLVKNAIDAMNGKGKIRIEIKEEAQIVVIKVSDTGKGISKKNQKRIFQPGFTTKKRGWGLGLSLTKRIVEDYHNGKINVEFSSPKKGTTFSIKLPKSKD